MSMKEDLEVVQGWNWKEMREVRQNQYQLIRFRPIFHLCFSDIKQMMIVCISSIWIKNKSSFDLSVARSWNVDTRMTMVTDILQKAKYI